MVCRHIHVVEGDHDRALRRLTIEFCSRSQLAKIRVDGQGIVLCHYAMRVWHHSSRGSWHLYGHSHGKLADAPATLLYRWMLELTLTSFFPGASTR